MMIAMATNDKKTLAGHIGRAKYLAFFENRDGIVRLVDMKENGTHAHNEGCHGQGHGHSHENEEHAHHGGHRRLISQLGGVEVLICKTCGPRLIEDLSRHNIQILGAGGRKLEEIASDYFEGKSNFRTAPSCGRHHH